LEFLEYSEKDREKPSGVLLGLAILKEKKRVLRPWYLSCLGVHFRYENSYHFFSADGGPPSSSSFTFSRAPSDLRRKISIGGSI
jgi:hypothetical protein